MAKYSLLIPIINPAPPVEELGIAWVTIFRTNDPDNFVLETETYLRQCLPIKLLVSEDLTDSETKHFKAEMSAMHTKVNEYLKEQGLPTLQDHWS